jgi:hypothetical protein
MIRKHRQIVCPHCKEIIDLDEVEKATRLEWHDMTRDEW